MTTSFFCSCSGFPLTQVYNTIYLCKIDSFKENYAWFFITKNNAAKSLFCGFYRVQVCVIRVHAHQGSGAAVLLPLLFVAARLCERRSFGGSRAARSRGEPPSSAAFAAGQGGAFPRAWSRGKSGAEAAAPATAGLLPRPKPQRGGGRGQGGGAGGLSNSAITPPNARFAASAVGAFLGAHRREAPQGARSERRARAQNAAKHPRAFCGAFRATSFPPDRYPIDSFLLHFVGRRDIINLVSFP